MAKTLSHSKEYCQNTANFGPKLEVAKSDAYLLGLDKSADYSVKTTMTYHLTPIRMVSSRRTQIANVGKDVEKIKHLYTVGGNVSGADTMEIPQKPKNRTTT